jgi:hypothetical protein
MESLVTMVTDINNTNSTTCSHGDVNNNVAHVALHQDSGHGLEMSVRNLNRLLLIVFDISLSTLSDV